MSDSLAVKLIKQPPHVRRNFLNSLTEQERTALEYEWKFWGRPEQWEPPGDWLYWLLLAGRGFGKSRTGSEYVRERMVKRADVARATLIAPTAADVRDIMIEGPAGIMRVHANHERPEYAPSKRRLTWPNGAVAITYSAEDPESLRGGEVGLVWGDEIAAWQYLDDAWAQLQFTLRAQGDLRIILTTTPKNRKVIRELLKDSLTFVTRGSSYDNRANLNPIFYEKVIRPYEGTRLGRQEIYAEILDDVVGALWSEVLIAQERVVRAPDMDMIVVAVDPAGSSEEGSDETGIVVAGRGPMPPGGKEADLDHGFVLADESLKSSPAGWAAAAVTAYYKHSADVIVAEKNYGGEMVEHTIHSIDRSVPVKIVTASRGKRQRAEPVSTLYEKRRVHHVGHYPLLEEQMCNWVPPATGVPRGSSPDRMDALVWGITELLVDEEREVVLF